MNKLVKSWILPLVLGGGLFLTVRPILAQNLGQTVELTSYLASNNVDVGSESVDGFQQVYYIYNGEKTFITQGGQNSRQPSTKGEYIVYVTDVNGAGQIFSYNIVTSSTLQLTSSSTNLEPKVSKNGWVVWEGWVPEEDGWQVFLFDGISAKQLTSGELSMNPDIEEDIVVYSRRDLTGEWRAVAYSKKEDKTVDITVGEGAREVKIVNRKVFLSQGKEEFPLTVDDLFLLNLVPLTATSSASPTPEPTPQIISEEEIAQEIQATSSAEIQEASPSGQSE